MLWVIEARLNMNKADYRERMLGTYWTRYIGLRSHPISRVGMTMLRQADDYITLARNSNGDVGPILSSNQSTENTNKEYRSRGFTPY